MTLRLGTRGSALAVAQASTVADAIRATGVPVELVEITTDGDRSNAPVARLGVGVFVSALREALAAKEIDLAVHSYKDLPTAPDVRLTVAAVPQRADPRDAVVARDGLPLAQLGAGARIGTGSPRRLAQLLALGKQLEPVSLRGNVDTRLRKVASGELAAVLVARAGLVRLGRADEITETLDPALMLPAPAQGALAVECRVDEPYVIETLAVLDHPATRAAVTAERALLSTLEAGCSAPVAGLAEFTEQGELRLRGAVFHPDGAPVLRSSRAVSDPAAAEQLGRQVAAELFAAGARSLLEAGRHRTETGWVEPGRDGAPPGADRPGRSET